MSIGVDTWVDEMDIVVKKEFIIKYISTNGISFLEIGYNYPYFVLFNLSRLINIDLKEIDCLLEEFETLI